MSNWRVERIKLFGLSNPALEAELDRVETELTINLGRDEFATGVSDDLLPGFDQALRDEAAVMREHYGVFYCLEGSIRTIIADMLEQAYAGEWWHLSVPEDVRVEAEAQRQREIDSGVTLRSHRYIDFVRFGDLETIVRANWQHFNDRFVSEKAFSKIMENLSLLRAPIANCCALADDEVLRLRLTMRDWFRLMDSSVLPG